MANRVLAVVRRMLNFGVRRDWIEANPASPNAGLIGQKGFPSASPLACFRPGACFSWVAGNRSSSRQSARSSSSESHGVA
jgi:hypothetical protein